MSELGDFIPEITFNQGFLAAVLIGVFAVIVQWHMPKHVKRDSRPDNQSLRDEFK